MVYLFDGYELDDENFCLIKSGHRMPLEPKSVQVLLLMVTNPGKLLEKAAILDAVWKGTFVEESTLTRTIALLRKQLGDDARNPKYIETVPTLGYRFVAQVETVRPLKPESSPSGRSPNTSSSIPTTSVDLSYDAPVTLAESDQVGAAALPRSSAKNRILLYGATVAGLSMIGIAFFMRYRRHEIPPLSTKDTIVLADFTNTSGEAVFDDTLRQGLIVQLEQSPVLRLASDGQIRKTLKLMGMKSDAPLTSEVSREVCQRIGGDAVLEGSVSRVGSEYVLGLRARRCSTGEELDAEQVQVKRKEDALEALSQIAIKFRTRIGESNSSINNLDTPLVEATTSSLDALKFFSQATRTFNTKGSGAAIPLFLHATELDPQFAMAYVWLGRMYADFGEEALSVKSTQRAYELRERSSDRERFSIDVSYNLLVSGNLARAKETCEAWEQMYPRDVFPRSFLSGIIYPAYGQYEKALDEAKKTVEIDPDFVIGYRNTALNFIALDRLGEADKVLQQASERKLFLPSFITDSYRMAFLKGDIKGMKNALEAAPANPWLTNYESATLLRAGHVALARVMSDRAVSLARQASRHDTEAQLQVAEAIPEALYGYPDIAKRQVKNALRLSKGRNVEYGAAFVMAMTGNSSEASKLVGDLTKRFPDDTLVQYDYVPTVQAALALTKKQPGKAIELLRETTPYELSQPLHPIYVRGQAFLGIGHPVEAAAEFQKILGHPGLVLNDPLFDLALLQLGRSYALLGDKTKARAAYEAVLQLWSTADPGLSINQQARKEYAKL